MSRRLDPTRKINQYFVQVRGFNIWRRVQARACLSEPPVETLFGAFGWFGRFGGQLEAASERHTVLSLQRTENRGRGGWITIAAPPVRPEFRFQEPSGEDEPWYFDAVLEGRLRLATPQPYPICVGGESALPPFDFTTAADYRLFLAVIADPTHPLCEQWYRWCPFDPYGFDAGAVTAAMRRRQWTNPLAALGRFARRAASELTLAAEQLQPCEEFPCGEDDVSVRPEDARAEHAKCEAHPSSNPGISASYVP
jgi:hypothetical protein